MDFETIAASVLASSVVAASLGYALKTGFENLLERQMERLKEELRREGKLHDDQYLAYTELVEVLYRIRNELRDMAQSDRRWQELSNGKQIRKLERHHEQLRDALFRRRAILPDHIFGIVHEINTPVIECRLVLAEARKKDDAASHQNALVRVQECLARVNNVFEALLPRVQNDLKVKDG